MTTVKFNGYVMVASDFYRQYKEWLELNCGVEDKDWCIALWRFDLCYGVDIPDPEVRTLFKLAFEL